MLVGFYYIAATLMSHPMEHDGHCHFNVLRVFALRAVVHGADSRAYLQHLWWWATVVGAVCGALIDLLLFDRQGWNRCERAAGCDGGSRSPAPPTDALTVEIPALDSAQRHVEGGAADVARGAVRMDERLA